MDNLLFIALVFFTIISCSSQTKSTKKMDYTDEKFEVGQVWNYKTRKGEENSTIQIVKIDKSENGEVFIHISIKGLRMTNSSTKSKLSETIGHLPFSRKSIVESVTTLKSPKEKLSNFEAGYQNWKEAFEAKKAGVFAISIADAVKYVETTMNQ